jgi:hypothetical protein
VLVGSNAKEVLQERTLERSIAALAILEPAILEAALGVVSCALLATIY